MAKLIIYDINIDFFEEGCYMDIIATTRTYLGDYAILDLPTFDKSPEPGNQMQFIRLPEMFLFPGMVLRLYSCRQGEIEIINNEGGIGKHTIINVYLGLQDFCWNVLSDRRARIIKFDVLDECREMRVRKPDAIF